MDKRPAEIIIYTGDGKGKTTAALGLAVATAAAGRPATVVQFLKGGGYTGELFAQKFLAPHLAIRQFGHGCPQAAAIRSGEAKCDKCGQCFRENRNPSRGYAPAALAFAATALREAPPALLVLDEISHALRHGLIELADVLRLLESRPPTTAVVLTGRHMPPALLELADRVTECRAVKHPMKDKGIDARRGIEY
jgi:cob(I)alamin adenosyltransferase